MKFQLTHEVPHAKYVRLIAHFESAEPVEALCKFLRSKFPNDSFVISNNPKLMLPNNPRWLIMDMGKSKPQNVAQFEPEFEWLCDNLINSLNAVIGPHFAKQEIKPGIRMRAMVPNPTKPGEFMVVSETDMVQSAGGLLVPSSETKQ